MASDIAYPETTPEDAVRFREAERRLRTRLLIAGGFAAVLLVIAFI